MTSTTQEEVYSDFPVDLTNWFPPLSPGFDWEWGWEEQDDNDAPRDITGWTAEMDLRETANGKLIKKLSSATGEITNGGVNGTFTVKFPGALSAQVSVRRLVTNVKVTDDAGNPNNHFDGAIEVKEIVTK